MRNMIVASTSTIHGSGYLAYILPDLQNMLSSQAVSKVTFIPFARPGGISHDGYTQKVRQVFQPLGITVQGLHEFDDPVEGLAFAKAIFTGGGNTFQLVKTLQDLNLMNTLRKAIYSGVPYIGTSAGSNICGLSMRTTNDMPIVQPQSFKTLGALGYNINPHYLDPIPQSTHMGETREQRIEEFHAYNDIPVVGLREGSYIRVKDEKELLMGPHTARLFRKNQLPIEVPPGFNFKTLS